MAEHDKWARYHAFQSDGKRKGGHLRFLMDKYDVHPTRKFKLLKATIYSKRCNKKIPVFIHIPKTGGTYISSLFPKQAFIPLSHSLLRENLSDEQIPVGLTGTRFRPSKSHFLFTTVRNPITFFRSYYHHVIGHGRWYNTDHYDYHIAKKGFEYMLQSIMNRDDKWPSRKFLFPQLFDQSGRLIVNWVNKNESLDEDLCELANFLGYEFRKGPKKRSAPVKAIEDYYTKGLMNQVCETYKREFLLFGYIASKDISLIYRNVRQNNLNYDFRKDCLYMKNPL